MRPWSMLEVFTASTAGSPLKPLRYGGNRQGIRQATAVARGPNKACPKPKYDADGRSRRGMLLCCPSHQQASCSAFEPSQSALRD